LVGLSARPLGEAGAVPGARASVEGQVHVGIDQPGQQRCPGSSTSSASGGTAAPAPASSTELIRPSETTISGSAAIAVPVRNCGFGPTARGRTGSQQLPLLRTILMPRDRSQIDNEDATDEIQHC
jgi:hypothetical protein